MIVKKKRIKSYKKCDSMQKLWQIKTANCQYTTKQQTLSDFGT